MLSGTEIPEGGGGGAVVGRGGVGECGRGGEMEWRGNYTSHYTITSIYSALRWASDVRHFNMHMLLTVRGESEDVKCP